jgi:cobalt-zinc-cadmium efflux system outer membrane protein
MKGFVLWGRLSGLAVLAASASGCAVHHYHHSAQLGEAAALTANPVFGTIVPAPGTSQTPMPTSTPPIAQKGPSGTTEMVAVAFRDDAAGAKPKETAPSAPSPTPTPTQAPAELTLDQVINATLLADPKLRAGFEAINQANGDALTASLKPNPTFNINQTLLPLTRPFTVDEQGGPPQLDIGLAYPIDWFLFGKRAAAM